MQPLSLHSRGFGLLTTPASSAYIAASRRSDRSLEARIESARRASEIHKKRTGRALRVTEADVINEEMYEEEDGDAAAYRSLRALVGGGSIDRRFAAYYHHQLHMRNAVDRELTHRTSTGLGVATGYSQHQAYPGQYVLQQQHYPLIRQTPQLQLPAYRQQPYAPPGHSHGRAMSTHIPQQRIARAGEQMPESPSLAPVTPVSPEVPLAPANTHTPQMSTPQPCRVEPTFQAVAAYKSPPSPPSHMESPVSNPDALYALYPFSSELPAESARFFAGTSGNGLGFDWFDSGTTYTTSKGFTTSLSPSQQSDPFESKTEDGLATTTGELKWQPSKIEPQYFSAATPGFGDGGQSQGSEFLDSLLGGGTMLTGMDAFEKLDTSSLEQYADQTPDNEVWGQFVDQDWLLLETLVN